jgi:hypothetical protein
VVALSWCCWRAFENPCRVWIQSLGVKRVSALAQRRLDMALRRDAKARSPAAAEAQRIG